MFCLSAIERCPLPAADPSVIGATALTRGHYGDEVCFAAGAFALLAEKAFITQSGGVGSCSGESNSPRCRGAKGGDWTSLTSYRSGTGPIIGVPVNTLPARESKSLFEP